MEKLKYASLTCQSQLHSSKILKGFLKSPSKKGDAGMNLSVIRMEKLDAGENSDAVFVLYTGVKVEIPEGYYCEMYLRSSLSKYGVSLVNSVGIIDNGYRGEIKGIVRIYNYNNEAKQQSKRTDEIMEKILSNNGCFQLVLKELPEQVELELVKENMLSNSDRSESGFGSTD